MFNLLTVLLHKVGSLTWIRGRPFCSGLCPQHILPGTLFGFRFSCYDAEESPKAQREKKEEGRDLSVLLRGFNMLLFSLGVVSFPSTSPS